ncbi:MAG: DUF2188 domain-containing protein [Nitriliruptor sp.]|nr:MAG: DUF2188 domain-containing protein [Nitriliruptor sp.]
MGSSNKDIQVQPTGGGDWAVRRRGQDRAVARGGTQAEAIERGRQTARKDRTELSVHGRDGQVRAKGSYGNDPRRIRG